MLPIQPIGSQGIEEAVAALEDIPTVVNRSNDRERTPVVRSPSANKSFLDTLEQMAPTQNTTTRVIDAYYPYISADELERYADFLDKEINRLEQEIDGPDSPLNQIVATLKKWLKTAEHILDPEKNPTYVGGDGVRYVFIGNTFLDPLIRDMVGLPADMYNIYGLTDYLERVNNSGIDVTGPIISIPDLQEAIWYKKKSVEDAIEALEQMKDKWENAPWYEKIPFSWIDHLVAVDQKENLIEQYKNQLAGMIAKLSHAIASAQ